MSATETELRVPRPVRAAYERMNEQLDQLQEALPTVPAKMLEAQRKLMCSAAMLSQKNFERVSDAWNEITKAGTTATKTVTGQARSASKDVADAATVATKTVVGQARAQGSHYADEVSDQLSSVATRVAADAETVTEAVIDAVDDSVGAASPSPDHGYETWTRDELYSRAQEIELSGRSTMTKAELVTALRSS